VEPYISPCACMTCRATTLRFYL